MSGAPDFVTLLSGVLIGGAVIGMVWGTLRSPGRGGRPAPRFERRNNPWLDRRRAGVPALHWPERRRNGRRHADTYSPRH